MPIDEKLIKQLLTDYKKPEDIIGENGLLEETTKAILERALQAAKQNGTKRTRAVSPRANKIISLPRLGGLHHRYAVAA